MDRLASQLAHLTQLFEQANKELYDEYSAGFHEESARLDKLIAQNEKIARGVLAVADMVQERRPTSMRDESPIRTVAVEEQPEQFQDESAAPQPLVPETPAAPQEQPPDAGMEHEQMSRKQLLDAFR